MVSINIILQEQIIQIISLNFQKTRNKKSNFKNNDLRTFDRILKEIDFNEEYDFEEILEIIDMINDDELKKAFEEVEDEFQKMEILN